MSAIEVISLIASIASLILAIGAICLSIVFFRMSDEASKQTTDAAKGIQASVERLENLFDKLYSDTFSIMKDTVSDMRDHIWNNPSKKSISNSDSIVEKTVEELLNDIGITDTEKIKMVSERLEESLKEKSLNKEINIKTKVSAHILATVKELEPISLKSLSSFVSVPIDDLVLHYLFPLRESGKITWDSNDQSINGESLICIPRTIKQ